MACCCLNKLDTLPSLLLPSVVLMLVLTTSVFPLVAADVAVTIDEEQGVGSFLTSLPDHASIYLDLDPEKRKFLTYAILNQNSVPAKYFRMDPKSGEITIGSRLDREVICDQTEKCQLTFNVAIQADPGSGVTFSNVISIKVTLNDVNDNPPKFPAKNVTLEVSESAKVGTELKISGAVDLDADPKYTVHHYNSTPWQDVFSISPNINPDGSSTINLRLEKELDREMQNRYEFNIMAWDGGENPRSDFMTVTVLVTDDNDNSPTFEAENYKWTIKEDAKRGMLIGQVTASDKDIGEYGRVTYSFSQTSLSLIKDVFAINSSTGEVTLTGDLSKLATSPFFMYVDAKDGGDPPRGTQTLVSVEVIDSGNNAPVVKINTVNAGDVSTLTIPESASPDFFVAFVLVTDSDKDKNGQVECALMSGNDFKLNPVPAKGYTLLLNRKVDREQKSSYEVFITCRDGGSPPLETSVSLTVNISDVNDNPPVFKPNIYTVTVPENRGPGHFITRVKANDEDIGTNGDLIYFLGEEASSYLTIQPHSGIVATKLPLDREQNATLRFLVYAKDNPIKDPKTGTATLVINISDVNDNAPTFNTSIFSFFVKENTPIDTVVGSLSAYDKDSGINGEFEFYFGGSTSGDMPLPFKILKNGSLAVSGVIDRESKPYYSFTALVRDKGIYPRSNAAPVEINVLDENDNDPVIIFPSTLNHSIPIHTKPKRNGLVLGQIFAYDVDIGASSELQYSIYHGNEDSVFSINVTSGDIILDRIDRLQNPMEYVLSIRVEDHGRRPRNVTTRLRIEVNFPNKTEVEEESNDHYIIIVGVIGGATVVLSVIIISAIVIILRSEKNERQPQHRAGEDGSFFKNKFCGSSTSTQIQHSKMVDQTEVEKDTMDSTTISGDSFGLVMNSGGPLMSPSGSMSGTKRAEDGGPKKVSFSLDIQEDMDDPHHDGRAMDPRDIQLSPLFPSNTQWKKHSHPDDINSDTSGESGTCDSGRGTSDEDIKFDSSPNKGGPPNMHFDPFLSPREIALHEFAPPSTQPQQQLPIHKMRAPPPSYAHCQPHIVASATPIPAKPGHSVYIHTNSGGSGGSGSGNGYGSGMIRNSNSNNSISSTSTFGVPNKIRSSYHGNHHNRRGPPVSQSLSSLRQPQRHHHRSIDNNNSSTGCNADHLRPSSSMSAAQQGSAMSVEDDASTTTSGSYVINPDDVRVDAMLGKDVIV